MESLSKCQFYCLNFNNEYKKNNMNNLFHKLGIDCSFFSGVQRDNSKIIKTLNKYHKKQWSITYSHLDIIYDYYYNSDKKFAIICEDDIKLHIHFTTIMEQIIKDVEHLQLEIVLLGYLLPYKLSNKLSSRNYPIKYSNRAINCTYHSFPEYLSGSHMYMITKSYARYLLQMYYNSYSNKYNNYFLFDKMLFRDNNRTLIYPMLAVENDEQDDLYHILCNKVNSNDLYE